MNDRYKFARLSDPRARPASPHYELRSRRQKVLMPETRTREHYETYNNSYDRMELLDGNNSLRWDNVLQPKDGRRQGWGSSESGTALPDGGISHMQNLIRTWRQDHAPA